MQEPRGPVLVSIPVDDWDQPTEPVAVHDVAYEVRPDPVMLARIGDLLDAAQRPAFVVGAAVDRAGAWDAVVQLAEAHNARVFTAPMAGRGGFPEDHRLFAGFLPAMREKIVGLLQGHDVVFALGAPAFTYHVEGHGPHVPAGAQLVQLIDDPATAAWTPEGISAVGNIRLGVQDLLARPAPPARPLPASRVKSPRAEPGSPMSTAFVLQTLDAVRGPNDVVVEEAPSARSVMQSYLPMRRAGAFYTMDSGGLGYGMPAAVGVALAKPGTRVIGLIGDGSSMYSIQALWSASLLKLPMTFVILNNRRYAALQDFAPVFGFAPNDPVQGTDLHGIDFVGLARAMGCTGERVSDPHALEATLRTALQSTGPTLIEVEIA
jgi:benzoylformate decarboxylase